MNRVLKLGHLFAFALLAGFMAVVQWSLVPAQNRLDGSAYTTLEQGMNKVLTLLMPALMIISLVTGLGVLVGAFRERIRTRWLSLVGVASLVVMVISTLIINAPINSAIDTWNPDAPPADWQALRDRWEMGHALRSYVGLGGFLAALAAVLWERD